MNVRPIFLKMLIFAITLAVLVTLTGCQALRQPEELAWQGLHAYDSLSTLSIVDDPCYKEGHPLTSKLIGTEPTRESVEAWAIGGAMAHAAVSEVLLARDMPRTYRVWQAVTLLDTGLAVRDSISVGVRVGAPNTRRIENGCR